MLTLTFQAVAAVDPRSRYNEVYLLDMLRFLFAVLLSLSFLTGCSGQQYLEYKPTKPAVQRTIKWQEHSNTALVISSVSGKPVLLYFTLDGCSACELMESRTFKDPEVAYFINENFIPIKINAEQEALIEQYKVDRFPTIIVLSSFKETKIGSLSLAVDGDDLRAYLRLVKRVNDMLVLGKKLDNVLKELN